MPNLSSVGSFLTPDPSTAPDTVAAPLWARRQPHAVEVAAEGLPVGVLALWIVEPYWCNGTGTVWRYFAACGWPSQARYGDCDCPDARGAEVLPIGSDVQVLAGAATDLWNQALSVDLATTVMNGPNLYEPNPAPEEPDSDFLSFPVVLLRRAGVLT